MNPEYDESLRFLRWLYPQGPWMLTAISVDKKAIDARTFRADEEEEVLRWLQLHEKRNLYYSVNVPVESAYEKKKLSKTDVLRAHYVHVDVDPRAGENVEEEQERILRQFETYRIRASVLVFSGGGYNGAWRLRVPSPIAEGARDADDAIARAIDHERRNWQLELDFDTPDHCRDVSRILRLPGTINRPNAEKIAKGRVPALARIVWLEPDRVYDLSEFMATPAVATNAPAVKGRVTANVERLESLDHLKVPEELKVIIAQGFDPNKDKWDGDRSDILFRVCCELVRHNVPEEIILGIITDQRYLISASVLDKGNNVTRYAMRQVQRAKDMADHPRLVEMNDQFSVILSYGSKPQVMVHEGRVNPVTGKPEPVFQSFKDWKDRVRNMGKIVYQEGEKAKAIPIGEWWLNHPRRHQYLDVTFEPGLDTPGRYNLWSGNSCPALPGDRHLRLIQHIREVICAGDEECFNYVIGWMARVAQQPRTQSMTALVLLGDRGTGKSIFCNFFGKIFQPHTVVVDDVNQLTGKFNGHLATGLLVVAEEAFDLRDKRHESVLKGIITSPTRSTEKKGHDIIQLPNYSHLILTSNSERVVPAGDKERRFLVLRVSGHRRGDKTYWDALLEDMASGGVPNLLHFLMQVDLREFDVTKPPQTEELRKQQEYNLPAELDWLMTKLESGVWLEGHQRWEGPVRKKELYRDYQSYLEKLNVRQIRGERIFHRFIVQNVPGAVDKQVHGRDQHDRPMVWMFPPLEACREAFDRARGWKHEWRELKVELEKEADIIDFPGKEVF